MKAFVVSTCSGPLAWRDERLR